MTRAAALAFLALSLALCLLRDGPGFGAVSWVAQLSVAGLCVVAVLAARPGWVHSVARLLGMPWPRLLVLRAQDR